MESPFIDTQRSERMSARTSTSSNQLYIAESLDLPEDTFRPSLDDISVIGENVTIRDRDTSIDTNMTNSDVGTPVFTLKTPLPISETPDIQNLPEKSPPLAETPKIDDCNTFEQRRPPNLLKLSLSKKHDNDIFVKPSPVTEVMSPARMLQFEVDIATSATPTMKRAAVDFDFFNRNKFEEYFDDEPLAEVENEVEEDTDKAFEETPVIVKADTVRHEICYGKYNIR
jgi:hypothetical protein